MAKDGKKKKVKSRSSTKYETSSDEDNATDEEDNLRILFANLNMQQKEKLNELISAIHEKDELLDTQEDFLSKENKKHVKVKNAYALEVEKCEKLSSELSTCHDVITNLRNENANLIAKVDSNVCDVSIPNLRNDNVDLLAKVEELNISLASLRNENEKLIAKDKDFDVCNVTISNLRSENDILHAKVVELKSCKPSTSTVKHTSICTRCRDINVDAIHDHLALIKKQNDHIAQLNAKINEHCWGLVLKCYELRTRQHRMLNVDVLRPLKHYLPKDLMSFGRRSWVIYHEGHTFVIRDKTMRNEI
jgi:hypothetical protein